MQNTVCPKCGGDLEFRQKKNVQGFYCKRCDWAVVTTYISQADLDETIYTIRIVTANRHDPKQIRILSEISGLNFITIKKRLTNENYPVIFQGKATQVIQVRNKLTAAGLVFEISPSFPYQGNTDLFDSSVIAQGAEDVVEKSSRKAPKT